MLALASAETALPLIIMLPLLAAILIGLAGERRRNLREGISLSAGLLIFVLLLQLLPEVMAGARPEFAIAQIMPGLSLHLSLEPLGMMFALIASFLWMVTTIYSIGYMRGQKARNQTRFYLFFAVAISCALGVAFSGNLLTLFVFYEMLTLSTVPLVTHSGTPEAKKGGRVYLGILLFTSICFLLLAIILTWGVAGTLDFRPGGIMEGAASPLLLGIILLLFFFGTGKAALMPFHRWLPAAMVAPTPVSALLHAVAVVKAGVFLLLKVSVYIFGLDVMSELAARDFLLYVAAATILLSSLVAMTQDNLKARLAYSTIGQLAYVVLGALLAVEAGIIGGGMHITMHAFGKITLFFCAGAIYVAAQKKAVSELSGLGRAMPVTFAAFLIGSLCIIGLPPFGGSWSKWFLALGSLDAGHINLLIVLMISSLLNIAYLLPIPIRAFFGKPPQGVDYSGGIKEAPLPCLIAIGVTATGCLILFFLPGPLYALLALLL